MPELIDWITGNWFELSAASIGLVAIFLQIKQNAWYWGISMVMVVMYIWVYIQAKLYADMSLQVYYLVVSIYGWWAWLFGGKKQKGESKLHVSTTNAKVWSILVLVMVGSFFLMGWILRDFTDSNVPWWDAFTTALSFAATWMLARKKLENWLVWIVVDITSSVIYFYKGLYPTMVLFVVLTILAAFGYLQWKKDINRETV